MAKVDDDELRRALLRRSIVGRVMFVVLRNAHVTYNRGGRNLSIVVSDFLIAGMIRLNDQRRRKPLSANAISRLTGLPLSNVRRGLSYLVKQKIIDKTKSGYIGNIEFAVKKMASPQLGRASRAIMAAGKLLRDLEIPILAMAILAGV